MSRPPARVPFARRGVQIVRLACRRAGRAAQAQLAAGTKRCCWTAAVSPHCPIFTLPPLVLEFVTGQRVREGRSDTLCAPPPWRCDCRVCVAHPTFKLDVFATFTRQRTRSRSAQARIRFTHNARAAQQPVVFRRPGHARQPQLSDTLEPRGGRKHRHRDGRLLLLLVRVVVTGRSHSIGSGTLV